MQNVVDVTFGEMSGKVNAFAKDAIASYGLSEKVTKQYMGTFGAMSKAFGYSTEAAYDQAAALTALTGDVASFYNLSSDEAYTKLKSVFTGETESLKDLGVVMTQSALDEYALQKGIGKTTAKMSEQEKVALRLSFVQDKLATASGDFARTSDGWANQTRVLSLRFDALKASIGQGLIAALTPVVRMLNQLVAYLQTAADAFSAFMQSVFGTQNTTSAISSGMSSAALASGEMAHNTAETAKSASKIKKMFAGFDALNILGGNTGEASDAAPSPSPTIDAMPNISGANAAVDGLSVKLDGIKAKLQSIAEITGIKGLWDDFTLGVKNAEIGVGNLFASFSSGLVANAPNFETLKSSIIGMFQSVSGTVTMIWGDMWLILTENFRLFTEENSADISLFFSNIIGRFTSASALISDVVGALFSDLGTWWNTSGKPLYDGIIKAVVDVGKWLIDIYNTVIAPVIQKITDKARELWDESLRPLFNNFLGLVSDVGDLLLLLWNNILKPVVDWIIKYIGPRVKDTLLKTVETVKQAFSNIAGYIDGVISVFRGLIQFVTGVFSGDWEKALDGLKTAFFGMFESLKNGLGLFMNPIIQSFETFFNAIIRGLNFLIKQINKISFEVPDWVPGVGGKEVGFNIKDVAEAKLPRLAHGGYVAANTPRLAIVGDNKREGEIIAPESKIAEAVAKGFATVLAKLQGQTTPQNDRPIYLTVKLGDDNLWEGFVEYHNSIVKRTGDTPLLI